MTGLKNYFSNGLVPDWSLQLQHVSLRNRER